MRVAYLMSHYPAVSHAFVLREVNALRDCGVDVKTLSVHRVDPSHLLATADRAAAESTFNILPTRVGRLVRSQAAALIRSPARYFSTLALAMRISPPGLRERLWRLFYFAEAMILLGECRRAHIDHLHAIFADSATDVAMLVSHYRRTGPGKPPRTSWSLAVHGSVEFYNVQRYALAPKLAAARFAVAISDFGRSQLMTLTSQDRWPHIHVVRCGVDLEVCEPPAERPAPSHEINVLFVGRLLHGKGLSLLFESIVQLRNEGLQIGLTVVGDGPARAEFEQDVVRLGLDGAVEFVGAVGQDEILAHYRSADLFCLPSFAEGIPVVAMEAMAMELPVVTTQIMGIPELITDGVEGRLVAPGRVDQLTEALRDVARSPAERARMGRAGREKIDRDFNVRNSACRLEAILAEELGQVG